MSLSPYIFPLFLLAIASIIPQCPILAMNSAAIPGQTFVPRPSKSSSSASLRQSHIPTAGSNSPHSVSLKKSPNRNSAALKVKASAALMTENGDGKNLDKNGENGINIGNGNEQFNEGEKAKKRILYKFKVGKQEFIIRWADIEDATMLYGMCYGNNKKHLKPPMPTRKLGVLTAEEIAESEAQIKKVDEFDERTKREFILQLSDVGSKHALVADQIVDGRERGIVGYLLFQYTPEYVLNKLVNLDDFYINGERYKTEVARALFQQLIKISEEQGVEAIEWILSAGKNENGDLLGEIDKMAGIEKDPYQGAIWRLPKTKFENIQNEDSDAEDGIAVLAEDGEDNPQQPVIGTINVKRIGFKRNVAYAQYRKDLYESWTAKYIWLRNFDVDDFLVKREAIVAIFAKLIQKFADKNVDGIAWVANRKMNQSFEEDFDKLGAIRNYHRWNLLKSGKIKIEG